MYGDAFSSSANYPYCSYHSPLFVILTSKRGGWGGGGGRRSFVKHCSTKLNKYYVDEVCFELLKQVNTLTITLITSFTHPTSTAL